MPSTVFYAWQSDTDPRANHDFISQALRTAIARLNVDLQLLESESELLLDRDTHGEPGMPAVADTILRKIDDATVFVADVTFVATLDPRRKGIPNANVGIELGYAAKSIGFDRIVCIFNDHFGSPDRLPFDLVHRRFPVRFRLSPEASADEREIQMGEVADALARELGMIVRKVGIAYPPPTDDLPPHAARPVSESAFVAAGPIAQTKARDEEGRVGEYVYWHQGPSAWLRFIPAVAMNYTRSQLIRIVRGARIPLRPFGAASRTQIESNEYGVIAIGHEDDLPPAIAMEITQVFQTGEIWGINRSLIEPRITQPRTFQIPWPETGLMFKETFEAFFDFSHNVLQLQPAITVVAGLSVLTGVPLVRERARWFTDPPKLARCLESSIVWRTTISRSKAEPTAVLEPFFMKIFDACAESYTEWQHD